MSKAGWYPDPGGQPGMFRWWDGSQWTPQLTAHPYAPPQPPGPPDPTQPFAAMSGGPLPRRDAGATGSPSWQVAYDDAGPQRSGRGPLIVLGLVGVLLVALVVASLQLLGGGRLGPFGGEQPASNPTGNVCPPKRILQDEPVNRTVPAGRVQGGKLSYPQLGAPWGAVMLEDRVPFGRDVYGQSVMVEPNYDGDASWVASIVVGELVAGDGFFSPEQGAEIVTRCVLGVFYADAEVGRTDRVNQATTVDGREAWLVEMHLSFDIPNLQEKGETAIIMIVKTGEESSSLYYASIPDSRPELLATAREVQGQLRVEP